MSQRSIAESSGPLSGKISRATLEAAILSQLGADRAEIVVGPRHGADAGIVDIGGGRVMAVTTDPFYLLPDLGWERAGWFAVHIVASDLATSGIPPRFAAIDLNLPPDAPDDDLRCLWEAVSTALADIDVAVVTGHTGRYDGCSFPTVGAATMFGFGDGDRYVTPGMASPGDLLIVTKGPAIETVGTLGASFPDTLARVAGDTVAREAEQLFWSMSVVRDAAIACAVGVRDGGVTGMHDATERGLWNAVVEIAEASGHGVTVDQNSVPVPGAVQAVCRLLDIDPFQASSEGTLVATCRPHHADAVVARLRDAGIPAAVCGEIVPADEGMRVFEDGVSRPLVAPDVDPFWPAYLRARAEWSTQ